MPKKRSILDLLTVPVMVLGPEKRAAVAQYLDHQTAEGWEEIRHIAVIMAPNYNTLTHAVAGGTRKFADRSGQHWPRPLGEPGGDQLPTAWHVAQGILYAAASWDGFRTPGPRTAG